MTAPLRGIKPAVSYNLQQAALAVGVGETALTDAANAGDLPSHWAGSRRLFLSEDLHDWVSSLPRERVRA